MMVQILIGWFGQKALSGLMNGHINQQYFTQEGMSLGSRCSFPRIYPQLKSNRPTFNCFCTLRPTFSSLSSSQNQWARAQAAFSLCLGEQIIIWEMRSKRRGSAFGKMLFHSFFFTLGNLQSFKSYSGFIYATWVLVGVPNTLMTSIKWSMLLSPMNKGVPLIISNSTQPSDQISIMVVQWLAPNINQGALQHLEQMQGRLGQLVRILADPKSHTTSLPLPTSKLCGLISLWQMEREWMQRSPLKAWQESSFIQNVVSVLRLAFIYPQRSLSQYSMTILRNWLFASSVVNVPSTRMVNSPCSIDTISIYLFLYLGSWKTRFTATICPVFFILDLYTFPKVPCPMSEMCSSSLSVRFLGVQSNVPAYFSRISYSALLHYASFFPFLSALSFFQSFQCFQYLQFFSSFLGFSSLCRLLFFFQGFSLSAIRFQNKGRLTLLMMGPFSVTFLLVTVTLF